MRLPRRALLIRLAAGLALVWLLLVAGLFFAMLQPPGRFGRIMARVPRPLFVMMAVMPFESLWNVARGGDLAIGEPAPDFELERLARGADDGASPGRVRLSSHFGQRPVVLVFGSYT